ncbi:hypothetical protein M011DRAFT_460913 [Sporormia fimetaria CBS 119925]|uniref:Uncharacterized protein n=1 Tax=Sporormia fimetaria CBS 119925 TaxID=1340428 RepID=A0A6A6V2V2_9PLEO|nr:hypothetical protein M011DRAFT_460913 [Sporormia fimetaria CBS 119925]
MAHSRDKLARPTRLLQQSKQIPPRRSARLNPKPGEYAEQQPSSAAEKTLQQTYRATISHPRGKKQSRGAEDLPVDVTAAPLSKRPRESSADLTPTRPFDRETSSGSIEVPLHAQAYGGATNKLRSFLRPGQDKRESSMWPKKWPG